MTDPDHQNHQLALDHLIDDSVGTHPQAAQPGEFAFEDTTSKWLIGQSVDRIDDA